MINLNILQSIPGCADGIYRVKAKGSVAAALYWADEREALLDWALFAYIPLAPDGTGEFHYTGGRGIPRQVDHVLVRAVSGNLKDYEEELCPISTKEVISAQGKPLFIAIMSDLHLSKKPWQVRKALGMTKNLDLVLLAGDMVNDGTAEQMELMRQCTHETLPDTPVLAVAGNHDYPVRPLPQIWEGVCDYPAMQSWLLERTAQFGYSCEIDPSGVYAMRVSDIEVIGLNAVSHWRRFVFQEGRQLNWLAQHLKESSAAWHIILCHAPLLAHNPQRNAAMAPYLSRDDQLQRIIDECRNVIYISGHTHFSMNNRHGCVEYDRDKRNIYINDGSVCPTTLKSEEPLCPAEFVEGNFVKLKVTECRVMIAAVSVSNGKYISRGYYDI